MTLRSRREIGGPRMGPTLQGSENGVGARRTKDDQATAVGGTKAGRPGAN